MTTLGPTDPERLELQTILGSGLFDRAPNLARLLEYVCRKKFDGEAEQIKEYNIAVEALGRSADFDKKRDSIVRVEALRLRKRLQEYYDGDGKDHALHIVIPPGQYVPQFIPKPTAVSPVEVLPPPAPPRTASWRLMAGSVTVAIGIAAVVLLWLRTPEGPAQPSVPATASAASIAPPAPGQAIRIRCGNTGDLTDRTGHLWSGDRYFTGGDAVTNLTFKHIYRTRDSALYQTRREGTFEYAIPLTGGPFELRLHFAETMYGPFSVDGGGESSRVFSVAINGKPVLVEFDPVADAGGAETATAKVFKDIYPAADGRLHLSFQSTKEKAFVNAIELLPGVQGRMLPIRLVPSDRPLADRSGQVWQPDDLAFAGRTVLREAPMEGPGDPEIYRFERFGNFSYLVPVVRGGRYGVTLRFGETWFGPGRPGGGGAGSRSFDVLINGVAMLRRFDIYREAGGGYRQIDKVFHGIEPTGQDKIALNFVPWGNYAKVNAIEIVDESK